MRGINIPVLVDVKGAPIRMTDYVIWIMNRVVEIELVCCFIRSFIQNDQ